MEAIFSPDTTFETLGLDEAVMKSLSEKGFSKPTGIQAELIPLVLAGRDVLGQAKTGTGKTAAFGLPLIQLVDPDGGPQALILAPTRELAVQVSRELRELGQHAKVKVTAIYGGQSRRTQIEHLSRHPAIIVGTPGRVMDLQSSGDLKFGGLKHVVLDEVDRMLDIGFRDDIRRILSKIKTGHQTIFVSATISSEIESLARSFMKNPAKIVSVSGSLTVAQVHQTHILVNRWDKRKMLLHLLQHEDPAVTLVFCATKREVDRLTTYLAEKGVDAHAMHGDMYQKKRDRVMERLRKGKLSVLVASDVAARGLDVEGISHVINYDLPNDPEVYVHRIGRTARLGRDGIAWAFVTPEEGKMLTAIESLINREVPLQEYPEFKPGPVPERVQREKAGQTKGLEAQVRTHRPDTVSKAAAGDATKFPGGVVPSAAPTKRMGGRSRTRRR